MNSTIQSSLSPAEIVRHLLANRMRWIVPAIIVAVLAGVFAVLRPSTWEASQTLIVRNEANGNEDGPGKFRHTDEMKTAQETMLELAKSRGVLRQALIEVGPKAGCQSDQWPSESQIEALGDSVQLVPPKGSEFGKTEVVYLKVRDQDPKRALSVVAAVCSQLQARVQRLRDVKAASMIDELTTAVDLAETDLQAATQRLSAMEGEVGVDLPELRVLHGSAGGDSDLRRRMVELENELRQARLAYGNNEDLLKLLRSSGVDAGRLLATPNRLLESQPALRRLKEGLVDAQLKTAQVQGSMTAEHPQARAALQSEQEISKQLHAELEIAMHGIEVDLGLSADRVEMLSAQLADGRTRLERLAGLRARYSNVVADAAHRTTLVEAARRKLAEARDSQAGARAASLIAAIDDAATGTHPVGPSRSSIVMVGLIGGLVIGVGVLFLTVPVVKVPQSSNAAPGVANGAADESTAERADNFNVFFRQALAKVVPARGSFGKPNGRTPH